MFPRSPPLICTCFLDDKTFTICRNAIGTHSYHADMSTVLLLSLDDQAPVHISHQNPTKSIHPSLSWEKTKEILLYIKYGK